MHAPVHQNTKPGIVVSYYVFASLAFLAGSLITLVSSEVFFGHYFQPRLLALTHLLALGWGTMMIFGALFQFLPVLLETPLYSERLAKLTFGFMATGIPGLIYAFWEFSIGWPLQLFSVLVITGTVLFSINIFKTVRGTSAHNIAADFISTSVAWLLLTVGAGIVLALNLSYLFLPADHLLYLKLHAHLGIVGWFLLLIIGVSSRLIPMFLLSPDPPKALLNWAYYLINVGLCGFIANGLMVRSSILAIVCFLSITGGLVVYITYIISCYKHRVRKNLDAGMRGSVLAFLILALPIALCIVLLWEAEEKFLLPFYIAYGVSIFFGFISTLILGQVYKTLPFIVWLSLNKNGNLQKKLPRDLYSETLAKFQILFHLAGFVILLPALLLKTETFFILGSACIVISAVIFNMNVVKIMYHFLSKKP